MSIPNFKTDMSDFSGPFPYNGLEYVSMNSFVTQPGSNVASSFRVSHLPDDNLYVSDEFCVQLCELQLPVGWNFVTLKVDGLMTSRTADSNHMHNVTLDLFTQIPGTNFGSTCAYYNAHVANPGDEPRGVAVQDTAFSDSAYLLGQQSYSVYMPTQLVADPTYPLDKPNGTQRFPVNMNTFLLQRWVYVTNGNCSSSDLDTGGNLLSVTGRMRGYIHANVQMSYNNVSMTAMSMHGVCHFAGCR